MRLLVSVATAEEVPPALNGGADIIDAKNPAAGALGPVDGAILRAIHAALGGAVPLSAALGDSPGRLALEASVIEASRLGLDFVKIGFALSAGPGIEARLGQAVEVAARGGSTRIVAVGYADWAEVGAPPPETVIAAAGRAGAAGVLLDTGRKDGRRLFDLLPPDSVARLLAMARETGLIVALAGALDLPSVELAASLGPDIIGVRGAACEGGRSGRVSAARVASLKSALAGISLLR